MTTARPKDEAARLREVELYAKLDIDGEVEFQELLEVLASISGTSIAMICLAGAETVEVIAKVGIDISSVPVDQSACAEVVRQHDLFVVSDSSAEGPFPHLREFLSAQGIGFYAGVPIITRDGFAIGSLSVLSRSARELSAEQSNALRIFSRRFGRLLELHRNIAERERAEAALRKSERRYRALLESVPDLIFRFDAAGHYIDRKGGPGDLFELPEALLGKHISDVLPANVAEPALEAMRRAVETNTTQSFEYQLEIKGNTRYFETRIVVSADNELFAIIRDVTERTHTIDALRQSEERFRQLAKATTEAIAIHDEGRILQVNDRFVEMFGYDLHEVIGKSAVELAAPESRDLVMKNILAGIEGPYEALGLRKDGSTFAALLHGRPIPYRGRTVRLTFIQRLSGPDR
jgi:PAS domain S-box-containing protein